MDALLDRLRVRFPYSAPDGAGARLVLVHRATTARVGLKLRPLAVGGRRAVAVQALVGRRPEGPPPPGCAYRGDELVHRSLLWEPVSAAALADHLERVAAEVALARTALAARALVEELFAPYA
jgi:hypothetical protein